jgi:hypothetical protein
MAVSPRDVDYRLVFAARQKHIFLNVSTALLLLLPPVFALLALVPLSRRPRPGALRRCSTESSIVGAMKTEREGMFIVFSGLGWVRLRTADSEDWQAVLLVFPSHAGLNRDPGRYARQRRSV